MKSLTGNQRLKFVQTLTLDETAHPVRRTWRPKPGSPDLRPLGLPTITDRARQTVVQYALEPAWEARFAPNSSGLRPGRSCHDAITAIRTAIGHQAKYVLDADSEKCFDRINQPALLTKVNASPHLRRQRKAWLQAGAIDQGTWVANGGRDKVRESPLTATGAYRLPRPGDPPAHAVSPQWKPRLSASQRRGLRG